MKHLFSNILHKKKKEEQLFSQDGCRIDAQLKEIIKVLENTFDNKEIQAYAKLIRNSGNINIKDEDGYTLFMRAIVYGKNDLFDIMIDYYDTDINAKNKLGLTPLMIAVSYSRRYVVYELINKSNLLINAQSIDGTTALMLSVDVEITNTLLLHPEIDVFIRNNQGKTALDMAYHDDNEINNEEEDEEDDEIRETSHPEIVEILTRYIDKKKEENLFI